MKQGVSSVQSKRPRVLIVGGSMGGLFAGLFFCKAGWDAQIFERVGEPLNARGAGIATHPELFDALKLVGIQPEEPDFGIVSPGRAVYGRDGTCLCAGPIEQVMTSWGRLYDLLRQKFGTENYHTGREFVRCRYQGACIIAEFADGSAVEGELLVAADGIYSAVRAQFEPSCQAEYAGYTAWRGLVPESAFSMEFRREIFEQLAFCLPPGEQCLGYPVAGEANDMRPGFRRYNIVWYRPADKRTELQRLLTDIDGHNNGISIAPHRIRPAVIEDMRSDAKRLLAPQFADAVLKAETPFIQPIYDLSVSRMVYDRVAIIGDAAFVARPHVGMGVTKAADDAKSLVDSIAAHDDIDTALSAYEAERYPIGQRVVSHARLLGCYLGDVGPKSEEEMRLAEIYGQPTAVVSETANADFLR